MRNNMKHNQLPEEFYETVETLFNKTKARLAGVLGLGALVSSLLLGCPALDRNARQNAINGFYKTAENSRATYFNGDHDTARKNHEEMWAQINQYRRDTLREPYGRLTEKDMAHLETNLNSTNVFSNGRLTKLLVE